MGGKHLIVRHKWNLPVLKNNTWGFGRAARIVAHKTVLDYTRHQPINTIWFMAVSSWLGGGYPHPQPKDSPVPLVDAMLQKGILTLGRHAGSLTWKSEASSRGSKTGSGAQDAVHTQLMHVSESDSCLQLNMTTQNATRKCPKSANILTTIYHG